MQTTRKTPVDPRGHAGLRRAAPACSPSACCWPSCRRTRTPLDERARAGHRARRHATSCPRAARGDMIAARACSRPPASSATRSRRGRSPIPPSLRGQVAVARHRPRASSSRPPTSPSRRIRCSAGSRHDQRAVTIPLDAAHGMIGQVQTGDHVDVFAGFQVQPDGIGAAARPVLRVLLQDVEVLAGAAGQPEARRPRHRQTQTQNVVLRVKRQGRAASWRSRPTTASCGSRCGRRPAPEQDPPSLVTLDRLLLGMDPIPIDRVTRRSAGVASSTEEVSDAPTTISALVALDAGVDEDSVRELLGRDRRRRGRRVSSTGSRRAGPRSASDRRDVVIVACAPESEQALWFIRETARAVPRPARRGAVRGRRRTASCATRSRPAPTTS